MSEDRSVQSLNRAFTLLESLAKYSNGSSLKDLSIATGLHKSTCHRLLTTLSLMGYVVKDSNSGLYRLTFKILELSNSVLSGSDLLSVAKPHLDRLSEEVSEPVHLVVPDGAYVVYIYKSDYSCRPFQMRSRLGLHAPMYCTAVGKCILSSLTDNEIKEIWLKSNVSKLTQNTITDYDTLLKQLNDIKSLGYAIDNEENEKGVFCVAVSVKDHTGRASAALSVSSPTSVMTEKQISSLVPKLLSCRNGILKDMGLL